MKHDSSSSLKKKDYVLVYGVQVLFFSGYFKVLRFFLGVAKDKN